MKLYKVLFADGSYFDGGNNYKNTKWLYIPKDKEIKQIVFALPDGNLLVLRDYEEYNHFIEATQNIYGDYKFTLRYQYLLGRKGDKIISYRITLFQTKDSRYSIGDITRREYEWGKEYNNKPTKGWKKGIRR